MTPYVKTREPDKDEFARLLEAAKGSRTMKEFAKLCGVNPSTFTRIMQRANKGASSQSLMEAIANNAAPESGVTIEAIMEANGFTRERSVRRIATAAKDNETAVVNIILKELLARGAELRMSNTQFDVGKNLRFYPDILISTDIFGDERRLWMMEVLPPYIKAAMEDSSKAWAIRAKQKTFQTISRFSFLDMQGADWPVPAQFSIVTSEEPVYRTLIEEFSETKVPTRMSLICVDIEYQVVEDEFFLPLADGSDVPQSYFRRVPPMEGSVISVDEFDDEDD